MKYQTTDMTVNNGTRGEKAEIRIAGKTFYAPSAEICGRTVVVTGNWLRRATIKDEDVVEGESVTNPSEFIDALRDSPLQADVFCFSQKIPDITPRYGYPYEWDNWAVIPLTSFNDWWEKLYQESRRNVRRAAKRGGVVKVTQFDDAFVKDIQGIYMRLQSAKADVSGILGKPSKRSK